MTIVEGEPRFELLKDGKVVDTVKVGRHDLKGILELCKQLGLKRDESLSWEKKKAEKKLEKAFVESTTKKTNNDSQQKKDL